MSTDFTLDRTGILRNAYQMAGIVMAGADPDSAQLSMGSDFLNMRIKALQSEGIILVTIERRTIALTSGVASYSMASDVLDVATDHPFVTQAGTNGINVPLQWWSRDQYMVLTVPTTLSQPTSIYIEKTATITANLYPVPDSSWVSLTLPVIKLLDDLDTGGATTGLQAKYLRTLVLGTALDLATAAGLLPRVNILEPQYENAKKLAVQDDHQRGAVRFRPDYGHLGRWNRSH